jgi:hypothetical protein
LAIEGMPARVINQEIKNQQSPTNQQSKIAKSSID